MSDRYAEGLRIGEGLVAASFPARDFHHRKHVPATACLLRSQPAVDGSRQLPGIIRRSTSRWAARTPRRRATTKH